MKISVIDLADNIGCADERSRSCDLETGVCGVGPLCEYHVTISVAFHWYCFKS